MALTINTNIVNDVGGYLLDTRNVKAGENSGGERVMLDEYLRNTETVVASKEDIPGRESTLPSSGVLVKNTMYHLGVITANDDISIAFPDSGDTGDWLYLNYSTPSDHVPTVTVNTTHSIGLDMVDDWMMESCSYTAMALWDGAEWVFAYRIISTSE